MLASPLQIRRRPGARGVTRFELAAGGSLLAVALLATRVLLGPVGQTQEIEAATRVGDHLSAAVAAWRNDNGEACPSVTQLVHEGYLDGETLTEDPWGSRFRVRCRGKRADVTSVGPDGEPDTGDDLAFAVDRD
mgnify:FL=1